LRTCVCGLFNLMKLLFWHLLAAQGALVQVDEVQEALLPGLLSRVHGFQVQPLTLRAKATAPSAHPEMATGIKVNDMVKVISGDSKGKTGKVLEVMKKKDMAVVEGINIKTKHAKPMKEGDSGSIQKKEAPIHLSNLALTEDAPAEAPAERSGEPQMRVRNVVMSAEGEAVDEGGDAEAVAEPVAEPVAEAEEAPADKPKRGKKTKDVSAYTDADPKEFITGTVSSVQPFGAFVRLEGGVDGLVHVSQVSDDFVESVEGLMKVGDEVKVRVIKVDSDKKQIALSMKEWSPPRERKPRVDRNAEFAKFTETPQDEKAFIPGTVNQITPFGAFVTIAPGVDGLLHISQIRDGYLGDVNDALTIGDEVQVRVTEVDGKKKRIGLSMKEWQEPGTEEEGGRGKRRGGRGGPDIGFGSDVDEAFRMSDDELAEMVEGDPSESPFVAAFARAEEVQKAKAEKKRYPASATW